MSSGLLAVRNCDISCSAISGELERAMISVLLQVESIAISEREGLELNEASADASELSGKERRSRISIGAVR